jgi:serine/threonine protein kinase
LKTGIEAEGKEMNCQTCQTPNDDTGTFCIECGAALVDLRHMPTIQDSRHDLLGRSIDGRYRLDSILGLGGMGTVYRGTRLLIGDEVAIKVLHPDQVTVPQAAERFRREAQAAARLKHPNAVTVYDFGVSQDGLFYLVMELVEGESVRNIIRQRGPFTPSAAAEVIAQACAALDEAHRQGIIHRDIKPDNIMVHSGVGGLRVKVLDFGIAKLRDQSASNLTQTGSVMGTPHYMSPEQCIGEELDSRSDIYSLGVVLYEMLCGVVPFNSPTSTAVVVQHVNQPPPPLRAVNMSIPPAVEAVVMHALEKRREARPQTAGALAQELNAAVSGMPIRQPTAPSFSQPVLPSSISGGLPTNSAGVIPTTVMPQTPSGSRAAMPANGTLFSSGAVTPARNRSNPLLIALVVLAVVSVGAAAYLVLMRADKKEGTLPDHFGIFVRNKDVLSELRRMDFRDAMQGREAMMANTSLPRVDPKPTTILYSDGQDIPLADLKLVQLDTIEAGGKASYWNYQVAPIEGHSDMKQIRIPGGLPGGKFAFALLNGYLDEGNHKFWPFEVSDGAPAPADSPQVMMIPPKPKPAVTPTPMVSQPTPTPQTVSTPQPPPQNLGVGYCTENNVLLRSAPNLNAQKINSLSKGDRLYIIEYSSNYDDWKGIHSNWVYVQPENKATRGWVFAYFVRR